MIEVQFNNSQTLKELIIKFNELISNRSIFIDKKEYAEILSVIGEIIEEYFSLDIELQKVKNLKFIVPVIPTKDTEINVVFSQLEIDEDVVCARGTIENGETVYSKFSTLWKIKK